jgi:hypothetical protein
MYVAEYMIIEASTGVEKELCKRIAARIKDLKELIPICNCSVTRKAFLTVYKLYPKIETLPESEKKDLKDFVIKNFPGKGVQDLVENCRIVYTAGKLI